MKYKKVDTDLVRDYLIGWGDVQYKDFRRRNPLKTGHGKYAAKDTWRCPRRSYDKYSLDHKYREVTSIMKLSNYYTGHSIECLVENALEHAGESLKRWVPVRVQLDNFEILGEADFVGKRLYEVKSTGSFKNTVEPYNINESPRIPDVYQVHSYMSGLNFNECDIIYVKRYPLRQVTWRVKYNERVFDDGIKRLEEVHTALPRNEPPEPEGLNAWECKRCPYEDCPVRKHSVKS